MTAAEMKTIAVSIGRAVKEALENLERRIEVLEAAAGITPQKSIAFDEAAFTQTLLSELEKRIGA